MYKHSQDFARAWQQPGTPIESTEGALTNQARCHAAAAAAAATTAAALCLLSQAAVANPQANPQPSPMQAVSCAAVAGQQQQPAGSSSQTATARPHHQQCLARTSLEGQQATGKHPPQQVDCGKGHHLLVGHKAGKYNVTEPDQLNQSKNVLECAETRKHKGVMVNRILNCPNWTRGPEVQ